MLGFCPDFFRFWLDFSSHSDTLNQHKWWKRCKINANFVKKNLFILFWPIIVCGRGSTSETHKDVRFLNGSEASGKLRYRDSQRPMRGKAHAGKASYAYSYVRTCAHGYMPRAYVHAANHGTATRDGIAATRKDLCVGRLTWENIICVLICVHAHMRTCVYTYVRTHARKHVRTYACAHVLHIWVRVWFFFPSVSLSTHRSTNRDTVASRMSRGTAVYRLLPPLASDPLCAHECASHLCCHACTHIWVCVLGFPSVSLPTHRSLRVAASVLWEVVQSFHHCHWLSLHGGTKVFFSSLVNSSCHCFTAK